MNSVKTLVIFLFSIMIYIGSMTIILLFALFLGNVGPYSISGNQSSGSIVGKTIINFLLISFFVVTHSFLARKKIKERMKKYLDDTLIRPVYLLFSIISIGLIILYWRSFDLVIYDFRGTSFGYLLIVLYIFGWLLEVLSSFQINHFHLFGISQAYSKLTGQPSNMEFSVPLFYRFVRHPIYTGWLLVFWLTPFMTFSHFLFAFGMTIYIRIATEYEENDLIEHFGVSYQEYKESVPFRYIPYII